MLTERPFDEKEVDAITQITMAYQSNKIEGGMLTLEEAARLYAGEAIDMDASRGTKKDVEEMLGHFQMFQYMLDTITQPLNQQLIKDLHYRLKSNVFEDSANGWKAGEYKMRPNRVASVITAAPEEVCHQMEQLIVWYDKLQGKATLRDLAIFHAGFENIHPFQDGNGRVGRILLFRECLRNKIAPVIIQDKDKQSYYDALHKAQQEENYEPLHQLFIKSQNKN